MRLSLQRQVIQSVNATLSATTSYTKSQCDSFCNDKSYKVSMWLSLQRQVIQSVDVTLSAMTSHTKCQCDSFCNDKSYKVSMINILHDPPSTHPCTAAKQRMKYDLWRNKEVTKINRKTNMQSKEIWKIANQGISITRPYTQTIACAPTWIKVLQIICLPDFPVNPHVPRSSSEITLHQSSLRQPSPLFRPPHARSCHKLNSTVPRGQYHSQ